MTENTPKKQKIWLWIVGGVLGLCLLCVVGFFVLGAWAEKDPAVQATGTARSIARITGTVVAAFNMTRAAMPSSTVTPTVMDTLTSTVTITNSPSPSPTETSTSTLDPSITPPTATVTPSPTYTITPTFTATFTLIPTQTRVPTSTPLPTYTPIPSRTPTPTLTPTSVPDTAGISDWIKYEDKWIGVKDIRFSNYLDYYRPEQGKIFVSLYIVALNRSDQEASFNELDFSLVDGGGEISGGLIFGNLEPGFNSCTVKPGGSCEGWWTTSIWDKPEVKQNLSFRWDPCLLFCSAMETPIRQK